jgi:hydrogenase large subunit
MAKLFAIKDLLDEVVAFVQQVYVPDVCAIGGMYPEWLGYGAGIKNYLAVPDLPLDTKGTQFDLPGGTIFDGQFNTFKAIHDFNDEYFRDGVEESIAHSWYDGDWTRHPFDEDTVPKYTKFDDNGKYSWVKAPRFQGKPMQVGPLAQVLIGYVSGHEPTKRWADAALEKVSAVAKTKVTPAMLQSTLGRHAARAVRCAVIGELAQKHWQLLVDNIKRGDVKIYNKPEFPRGEVRGFGFHEAPRGALSHWVVIRDGHYENYQAVVPTTWNASPRDAASAKGPYEAALVGNPVVDPEKPLEVLRTIHSFDPCLACAVHTLDPEGREIAKVKVL